MSQPFDREANVPLLRSLDKDNGEFWVGNPWAFSSQAQNLSMYERNGVYLNYSGNHFLNVGFVSGADSNGDGRTVASYDITNDGMPELFVRQVGGGPLLVYRNRFPSAHWLRISLRGSESNSFGIGAKLVCTVSDRQIFRDINPIINFLSQMPAVANFGLGHSDIIDRLEIHWPSGQIQVLEGVAVDQHIIIHEGIAEFQTLVPGQGTQLVLNREQASD